MTLSKFTNQPANEEIVTTINDIIDTMDSTTGANIDLSNLSSTGNSKFQIPLVSGTSIKTINSTSLLGSGDISVLQNTATGTNALTIGGSAATNQGAINIGHNAYSDGVYSTAVGTGSLAKESAVALGQGAVANNYSAIQIGYGENNAASSLGIGFYDANANHKEYQLLDGTTGLIPDARISTNIARTSQIPTVPTKISDLTDDTATTPIDKADTLTNLTATVTELNYCDGVTSDIQTQLDGKVSKSGDTMTGNLAIISEDDTAKIEFTNTSFDATSTTAPASNLYAGAIDILGSDNYHVGHFRTRHNTGNYFQSQMGVKRNVNNTVLEANITVGISPDGTSSCTFPNTNCVDGQWVIKNVTLSTSSAVGSYNLTNTLKAQLPNNSYNYEILLAVNGRSTASSQCTLKTAYTSEEYVLWLTANSRSAGTFIILPVDTARTLTQKVGGTAFGAIEIKLQAYRRIGTNS